MDYIDIHCHLDSINYNEDREEVLARMKENKVGAITIGTDLESSKRAVEIAEKNEQVWACIGVHPITSNTSSGASPSTSPTTGEVSASLPLPAYRRGRDDSPGEVFNTEEFTKLIQSPKVVAIGECGLDYFRLKDESDKERQKKLFIDQIEFAIKHNKPLMLHCRDAYRDVLNILEEYRGKVRGNCHFFAGSVEEAKGFLDLGFTMSFTGVITFSRDYDEVVRFLPLDSIMSETDAPFVAPVPFRGKRNEPSHVVEVVKKMAEIRGENVEVLKEVLVNNAKRVFNI